MRRVDELKLRTRLGIFLVSLATVTSIGLSYTSYRVRQVNECQYRFNQQFIEALRVRSEFPARESRANREFYENLVDPKSTQAENIAAAKKFIALSKSLEAERAATPYPTGRCDR